MHEELESEEIEDNLNEKEEEGEILEPKKDRTENLAATGKSFPKLIQITLDSKKESEDLLQNKIDQLEEVT